MKTLKVLLGVILILGISNLALAKPKEKIIKVAKNNVVVQKILFEEDGSEVVIETEEYGQNRIDEKLAFLYSEIDYWDKVDLEKKKQEIQTEIDKIEAIQVEMDKEMETK